MVRGLINNIVVVVFGEKVPTNVIQNIPPVHCVFSRTENALLGRVTVGYDMSEKVLEERNVFVACQYRADVLSINLVRRVLCCWQGYTEGTNQSISLWWDNHVCVLGIAVESEGVAFLGHCPDKALRSFSDSLL